MADYQPVTAAMGNIVGICPICECMIFRRVSLAKLEQGRGKMEITVLQVPPRLNESAHLSVNCDFRREPSNHADAQPKE